MFHGPQESKHVFLNGPILTTSFQSIFEAFLEPAAKRCLNKFEQHDLEVFPEDIFDEAINMLKNSGFHNVIEESAILSATRVCEDDFGSKLGDSLKLLMDHNSKCQNQFAKDINEQMESTLE